MANLRSRNLTSTQIISQPVLENDTPAETAPAVELRH